MRKFFCFTWLVCLTFSVCAQEVLSLDSCRSLAIANNKELLIGQDNRLTNLFTISERQHLPITSPIFPPPVDICAPKKKFHY